MESIITKFNELSTAEMNQVRPMPKMPIIDVGNANIEDQRVTGAIIEELNLLLAPLRDKSLMIIIEKIFIYIDAKILLLSINEFLQYIDKILYIMNTEIRMRGFKYLRESPDPNIASTDIPNYYFMLQQLLEKNEVIYFVQLFATYIGAFITHYNQLFEKLSQLMVIKPEQLEFNYGKTIYKINRAMSPIQLLGKINSEIYIKFKTKITDQINSNQWERQLFADNGKSEISGKSEITENNSEKNINIENNINPKFKKYEQHLENIIYNKK